MSEVHLARDVRLHRDVAVKVLRADLARDPSFYLRFRREAQNAAAKEARRVLREQQKDEWKDKWDHWTDELGDQWAAFKQRLKSEGGKA